jgi:hypothetical protein
VHANVAERRSPEDGIDDGVREHVTVGMARKAGFTLEQDAAED